MRTRSSRPAFTLLELLIVVAIITMLLGLMAPSLARARAQARAAVCGTNVRQILLALQGYAARYDEWFPSPVTTGLGRYNHTEDAPPPITVWDVFTPLMGLMDLGDIPESRDERFGLSTKGVFHCPSNSKTSIPFGISGSEGDFPEVFDAQSYGMPMAFGYAGQDHSYPEPDNPFVWAGEKSFQAGTEFPEGYRPRIPRVGKPAEKIFLADALRYRTTNGVIDTHLIPKGRGVYTSEGGWHINSREYSPEHISGTWEYSYRHGAAEDPEDRGIQAGFFDGHVEYLIEPASHKANYWYPTGTKLSVSYGLGGEQGDADGTYEVK